MSKVLSIIPAIISVVASYIFYRSSGIQGALFIFMLMFLVFPLSMIWFPQAYVGKTNWVFGRLSSEHGTIVLYGWILLMIPMVALLIGVYRSI